MKDLKIILAALFLSIFLSTNAQTYEPNWKSLDTRPMPEWFNDAKIGIFIHWGVYSVPSYRTVGKERYASYAEWYQVDVMNKPGAGQDFHNRVFGADFEYRQFAPLFKAELFNPDEWADLFQRAGAKYVVLTSKHHDGYCLWPSKTQYSKNWNSMEVGPKRDLVGDLTTAVKTKGLKWVFIFHCSSGKHRLQRVKALPIFLRKKLESIKFRLINTFWDTLFRS